MLFSVITKNSNWGILTKNSVTIKRLDGIRDEKLQYFGGNCLKGGLGQFSDLRGSLARKMGGVFKEGLIPQCTLCY